MRDEPNAGLERRSARPRGAQKGRWSIQTAGRWSWKSKPAKECSLFFVTRSRESRPPPPGGGGRLVVARATATPSNCGDTLKSSAHQASHSGPKGPTRPG